LDFVRFRCCDADMASQSTAGRRVQIAPTGRWLRGREPLSLPKCDVRHTGSGLWRIRQSPPAIQLTRYSGNRCASYRLTSVTVFRRTTPPSTINGCGTIFRLTMIDLW